MEKLVFADGDKIGVFDGEQTRLFESEYFLRQREYAESRAKNDEWKFGGDGAKFRGDYDLYRSRREPVRAFVNGVQWDGDKVVYSFTVDGASGVYRKDVKNEKASEEHILTSMDEEFLSLHRAGSLLAVAVNRDGVTSGVGTIDCASSELKTLTEGDSLDRNPYFSPTRKGLLYFDSAGAGRNADGEFTGRYAPAVICSLDLNTMELREEKRDDKFSFVKPKIAPNGDLYCIRRPNKERKSGNVLLDVLLFPFRILKAIFGFLQAFVSVFGNTSLTTDAAGGPFRARKTDSRKLYIDGKLLDAEKELKRNKRKKDKEYGFIPMSWKLVRVSGGKEEILRSGVCDFALCKDGGFYCTNGRRIFYCKDGATKKIAETERCLCLATESASEAPEDLFSL